MKPSDFPKGPDGVRFRVEANVVDRFRSKDNFWPRDEWVWLCNCFDESHANMIAAALEQVANQEQGCMCPCIGGIWVVGSSCPMHGLPTDDWTPCDNQRKDGEE